MSGLDFFSPDGSDAGVVLVSPLARIDGGSTLTDVSSLGKLEVRGDIDALETVSGEHVVPLGPDRALLVVHGSPAAARVRLRASGYRVYDMTAALAAFEIEGEDLLRRLTELDLRELPAVGSIARGTTAVIERISDIQNRDIQNRDTQDRGERFRLYVPQELGHFAAEVALDMAKGLAQ
jgi:hypothetical protein